MSECGTPGRAYSWPIFEGTKQLKAQPMSKADYCALRGWEVPADENPNGAGYVVEYQDGGAPNVEGFAGYVSWSPADVFARSYRRCGSHIERMEIEHADLSARTEKLDLFLKDPKSPFNSLTPVQQGLMCAQLSAMQAYQMVLNLRLGLARA